MVDVEHDDPFDTPPDVKFAEELVAEVALDVIAKAEAKAEPVVISEVVAKASAEVKEAFGKSVGSAFQNELVIELEETFGTPPKTKVDAGGRPLAGISRETVDELVARREQKHLRSLDDDLVAELTPEVLAERDPMALTKIVSNLDFGSDDDEDNEKSGRVKINDHVDYLVIGGNKKEEYRSAQIVHVQGNPDMGTISAETPLGKALLGCFVNEEVLCVLPIGEVTLKVLRIQNTP